MSWKEMTVLLDDEVKKMAMGFRIRENSWVDIKYKIKTDTANDKVSRPFGLEGIGVVGV